MTWKGWEDFAPMPRGSGGQSTRKTPIISAARAENINDSARAPQAPSTPPKRSKYGAEPTEVDGIRFASQKEAARYGELKLLEQAGEIWDLELQPKFPLVVPLTTGTLQGAAKALSGSPTVRIGEYRGDFLYWNRDGKQVEDVKGFKTPLYKWKKRHVEAQFGITIHEI